VPDVPTLDHIGIAVRSIEACRSFYETVLGAEYEGEELVDSQEVRVAFFRAHHVRLELLEPTSADSPVHRFLERRGEGLHHVAFSVADIEGRIAALRESGIRMVDASPRTGSHGMRIAFIHPSSAHGVLTELCERCGGPPEDSADRTSPGAGVGEA